MPMATRTTATVIANYENCETDILPTGFTRPRYRNAAHKLEVALGLYWEARKLKAAYYRFQFPDWNEEKIQQAVKEWMLYART